MDQDVQGKPIHMNKTRPRRMSRSSRLRFFNASRSASGPSMMSRLRNQSHVAQRRAQDGHSQRRAQQLSCLQRRQDDGRVAQRSGAEHHLEGPCRGCRSELYLESLFSLFLLNSGVGLVAPQARVAHPAAPLLYFYQGPELVSPVVAGPPVSRMIHHILHILETTPLLCFFEGLLHVRIHGLEQRLVCFSDSLAVEEGAKVQEIRTVEHQTLVAEEEF
mmetsp:Transcript_79699/g.257746  ORF Transcript_79699/g.257746 Transcript_79699/m.257746 type:complete len:218 (+) Transcript_79699:117-770(+)